ncbi:transcriptional regulator [Burkholderia glumae]|uniref:transcriptional regulator n=1 Tax=Burkholderia glumae TaxID=337 RepID=UPI003B9CB39A
MDLKTYLSLERGRLVKLAADIDAHASDVSAWANRKRAVPIPFGLPIEKATGGAVPRVEMFPEKVIRDVWPELIGADPPAPLAEPVAPSQTEGA